jgi:hypothetical protein
MIEPEILFLKYAFPCTYILQQRGKVTNEEMGTLEDAVLKTKVLPREFLEKIYPNAFRRIDDVAATMQRERWDVEVIREYFRVRHNQIIDAGIETFAYAPEKFKDLCRVHEARVMRVVDDVLVVEYSIGKKRNVLNKLVPSAKEGDIVTIHYGYAIEKL